MAIRYRELCDLILYELYQLAAEPDGVDDMAPYDLYNLAFENITSSRFYDAAIETLGEKGWIEKVGVLPDTMAITTKGISYVDAELDDINSFLWGAQQENADRPKTRIPAASRFVDLDHNSREYAEAIAAGEGLIEALRGTNAYPDFEYSDKQQRLAELEAGYGLLRAPRVNPATVKVVLAGVLTYLVTKFADEPIGELAKTAWATLKTLLGIH